MLYADPTSKHPLKTNDLSPAKATANEVFISHYIPCLHLEIPYPNVAIQRYSAEVTSSLHDV